jgi:ribonuclease J
MMAEALGIPKQNIFVPEAGSTVIVQKGAVKAGPNVQAGNIYVDGYATGDMDSSVLKDRQLLAEDGFLIVILNMLLARPDAEAFFSGIDIITRGFHATDGFTAEMREVIKGALNQFDFEKCDDAAVIKALVKKALRKYIFNKYKQNPMIMPIILEVN